MLDYLLEDARLDIEAITGISAGAMNAVVLAEDYLEGGREGARESLAKFWRSISGAGAITNECGVGAAILPQTCGARGVSRSAGEAGT